MKRIFQAWVNEDDLKELPQVGPDKVLFIYIATRGPETPPRQREKLCKVRVET